MKRALFPLLLACALLLGFLAGRKSAQHRTPPPPEGATLWISFITWQDKMGVNSTAFTFVAAYKEDAAAQVASYLAAARPGAKLLFAYTQPLSDESIEMVLAARSRR